MEIGNTPDKEPKVMIVKMFEELRRLLDKQSKKLDVLNRWKIPSRDEK